MPNDPWIWVLALVIGGAVLIFALRRGGRIEAGVGPTTFKFEPREQPEDTTVSVLDEATVEDSTVGDVIGTRGEAAPGGNTRVDVAKGAKFRGSEVRDIVGIDRSKPGAGS